MESPQIRVETHFAVTTLFSIRPVSLVSSQHCPNVDTDSYGLFPLPVSDSISDSDKDSCTMQDFSIGSDSDSYSLIEIYVIGMEICP